MIWPISTGPYGVGDLVVGSYINFDQRPTWWAYQTRFVDKMPEVIRFLNEDATEVGQKMVNNEADICLDMNIAIIQSILSQNPKVTTWTGKQSPYGNVDWWPISVYFNNLKPPFDDNRVRWAVAYAIDQQAVIDAAWGGAGIVTGHPFPAFPHLMTYINGISDLLTTYNVLEFNLTKTNTLMTAAGFTKDGEGYWIDGLGIRPAANLYAPMPLFEGLGQTIATQLRTAGFECDSVSPGTVWSDIPNGIASIFLWGHGGSTYDPLDTFNLYRPENINPIGTPSYGNMARWSNTTFTNCANQMSLLDPDDSGMAALFHSGMAVWLDELPDCPICQWMHRVPFNTTYWTNFPDQNNNYASPALWLLSALQVLVKLKTSLPDKIYLPSIRK